MASMNISVPDAMREWVQNRIESGDYASVSDYVRDLIRRDQSIQARRLSVDDIRRTIEEGRASGRSSPAEEVFARLEDSCASWRTEWLGEDASSPNSPSPTLAEIALYIAADSPKTTLRCVDELRQHCHQLTEHPARNPLREQYGAGVRVAMHANT